MAEAVRHFTNVRRCENGLNALAADSSLQNAASTHSSDMVRLGFFGHNSPAPGRAKLRDRLKGNGVQFRAAAENLGLRPRLKLESGRRFAIQDRATCAFTYDGQQIKAHTYRSIARDFVRDWEASPAHRKNLFDSRFARIGVGTRFKPNPDNCGDIIATQNFAA